MDQNWKSELAETDIEKALSRLVYDGMFGQTMMVLSTGPFLVAFALILGGSNTGDRHAGGGRATRPDAADSRVFVVEGVRMRKGHHDGHGHHQPCSALFAIAMLPWFAPENYRIPLFLLFLACHYGSGRLPDARSARGCAT